MKVGIEDRRKLTVLLILVVVAVIVFVVSHVASPQAASGSGVAPAQRTARTASDTIDPAIHVAELGQSEETEYAGAGRNIFLLEAAAPPIPQPIAPPRTVAPPVSTAPAGPVGPPPINLKFYGFASSPGQPRKIFLSDGDNVFVGGEGDIVDRHYKIVRIGPTSAEIEDVQNNNRQTLPLV